MKRILLLLSISAFLSVSHAQTTLDSAINLSLKDIHGQVFELYDILDQGKHVVIDFFSVSCGSCQLYAPDVKEAYTAFGCNEGNMFFIGIDKGNWNEDVISFNNEYGIEYPSFSGMEGNGNAAHWEYDLQGTPSIIVIAPDRSIAVNQVFPPTATALIEAITGIGGVLQPCGITGVEKQERNEGDYSFFPNPASEYLTGFVRSDVQTLLTIEIFDLLGKQVFQSEPFIAGMHGKAKQIPVSALQPGMYLARMVSSFDVIFTQKIIIE